MTVLRIFPVINLIMLSIGGQRRPITRIKSCQYNQQLGWALLTGWYASIKPKFHYANFATKSGTSSQQSRGHKSWKSATQITSPTFMICVRDKVRATQTGLSRTCHKLCRKHLDMSRWFVSATFVICVGDFHRNFMVSWFVTVCVRDFHDLRPWLYPQRSFG